MVGHDPLRPGPLTARVIVECSGVLAPTVIGMPAPAWGPTVPDDGIDTLAGAEWVTRYEPPVPPLLFTIAWTVVTRVGRMLRVGFDSMYYRRRSTDPLVPQYKGARVGASISYGIPQ